MKGWRKEMEKRGENGWRNMENAEWRSFGKGETRHDILTSESINNIWTLSEEFIRVECNVANVANVKKTREGHRQCCPRSFTKLFNGGSRMNMI